MVIVIKTAIFLLWPLFLSYSLSRSNLAQDGLDKVTNHLFLKQPRFWSHCDRVPLWAGPIVSGSHCERVTLWAGHTVIRSHSDRVTRWSGRTVIRSHILHFFSGEDTPPDHWVASSAPVCKRRSKMALPWIVNAVQQTCHCKPISIAPAWAQCQHYGQYGHYMKPVTGVLIIHSAEMNVFLHNTKGQPLWLAQVV